MKTRWWLVLMGSFAMPAFACDELTVADAWVRLAPPNASVMAGYLTLANSGKETVTVRGGSSAGFNSVELHNMTHENGVMQMRKLDLIEVKVDQTVKLAPGGLHLMLIGPKRSFVAGDKIDITLRLCEEKEQVVSFPVREQQVSGDEHAGHAH